MHKSDVGGVRLDLSGAEVESAAREMLDKVNGRAPQARLAGFSVEEMISRPQAFELLAGIADDPVFGPVILFGQGGTAAEIIRDRAIGLPPLNLPLAREMIGRTRVASLLEGYRDRPAAALLPRRIHLPVQSATFTGKGAPLPQAGPTGSCHLPCAVQIDR